MLSHFLRAAKKNSGIQYVGGVTGGTEGDDTATNNRVTLSLTGLTGGIGSSVAANDIIIVLNGTISTSDRDIGPVTSGYTEIADLYSSDDRDANLSFAYKVADGTETSVVLTGGSGSSNNPSVGIVQVWRGVSTTTPLDVTSTTATGTNTGRPNVPSITPTTAGCVVLGMGVGTASDNTAVLTASGLSNVLAKNQGNPTSLLNTNGIIAAYKDWTSGAYDMAQFGGGSNDFGDSWCAVAVVLRPA